jgi:hypothetical protein
MSIQPSRNPFFAEVKSRRVPELVGMDLEIEFRNPPGLRNNGLNVAPGHWRTPLTQKDPGRIFRNARISTPDIGWVESREFFSRFMNIRPACKSTSCHLSRTSSLTLREWR